MREILHIKFGSHLYGTNTENSDYDFKKIFIPSGRDIVLQRVVDTYNTARPKGEGEKNYAGEEECEAFSLQKYLALASQGQTVALDVLFVPDDCIIGPISVEWQEIRANKDKLITKKSTSFVKYCQQQANKYGIKGSRIAAARRALDVLNYGVDTHGSSAQIKLSEIKDLIEETTQKTDHMDIIPIRQIGGQIILYWEICGRKLQYTASLVHARDVIAKLVAEYGGRAIQAEKNEGIDWKALSHAVRIGQQALELLEEHKITFPLRNASEILDIKRGKIDYKIVSRKIEDLLEEVIKAESKSSLPNDVDQNWIDSFVFKHYFMSAQDAALKVATLWRTL